MPGKSFGRGGAETFWVIDFIAEGGSVILTLTSPMLPLVVSFTKNLNGSLPGAVNSVVGTNTFMGANTLTMGATTDGMAAGVQILIY